MGLDVYSVFKFFYFIKFYFIWRQNVTRVLKLEEQVQYSRLS